MKCELIQYQMAAYAAHELPPETSLLIEKHLNHCPECQAWYQEITEMSQIWEDPGPVMDMPDIVAGVMEEVRQMPPLAVRSLPRSRPRESQKSKLAHFGLAACLTFCLFQFGIFEHLGNGLTEATQHLSTRMEHIFKEGNP
ncbi:hypothetical protein BK138_28595 [Paenibacillus rhizosphaerae]|uniref:Anti-sigma-W factor RsiW n=1 Tax=Paenibacillus rhizosphaerae TaxID=297318 RepID=A0A1R1EEI4_9BACL|nr:zf-HC2 domain-containing protein [Paenibacillus rhizosphaerae]OMF50243.1 hypothetical protein BK138_28595 [Paenibacillus rhizosphaerae]